MHANDSVNERSYESRRHFTCDLLPRDGRRDSVLGPDTKGVAMTYHVFSVLDFDDDSIGVQKLSSGTLRGMPAHIRAD